MDTSKAFPEDARAAELAAAAAQGDREHVRTLVRGGADANAHGDQGVTPLQFALMSQNLDGMRALLDAGADPNRPGGDANARHGQTQATPLAGATGPRTDAQLRMLLDAGADPNLADRTGNTPLHQAAMINAGEHVLLLLEKGASPNAKNAQDATFQPYFFRTDDKMLNDSARAKRKAVSEWLRGRGVPLEASAR